MKYDDNVKVHQDQKKVLIRFLSKVDIFERLNKHEIKNFITSLFIRRFKKGEQIFKKGYPNVVFYILKEGKLRMENPQKDSDDNSIEILPGECLGEVNVFSESKRTATVIADEDSVLLAISKENLKSFIHRFPRAGIKILFKFNQVLSERLVQNFATIDKIFRGE